jgi:hypothetical protein
LSSGLFDDEDAEGSAAAASDAENDKPDPWHGETGF